MKKRLPDKEYELIIQDKIRKAAEIGVPYTHAVWSYDLQNPNEKNLKESFNSQSYVRNNLVAITAVSNHIAVVNYPDKDTRLVNLAGVSQSYEQSSGFALPAGHGFNGCRAFANETNRGIIIGTSTTPENILDRHLPGLITHGNSANQMAYQAEHFFETVFELANNRWRSTQARRFINNSGNAIGVSEIGLVTAFGNNSAIIDSYLLIRDVLATPINVVSGGQLTLTLNKYTVAAW